MKTFTKYLLFILLSTMALTGASQDVVDFYISPERGCSPSYISLSNSSYFTNYQGVVNYNWYIDNNLVSNNQSVFDTILSEPRGYQCRLEAYDSTGAFLQSADKFFEVIGTPDQIHVIPGNAICPGEMVTLEYFFNGSVYNDRWDVGGNEFRYGNHQEVKFDTEGEYVITLYIDTECGSDTLETLISVSSTATPSAEIRMYSGNFVCPDDQVQLETSSKSYGVDWNMGDGTMLSGSVAQHSYTSVGTYPVVATVTNACGNTSTARDTVYVTTNRQANANFHHWFEQGDNCPGMPVRFEAHDAGTYFWNFGDGTSSNIRSPQHFYADTGSYQVRLIVINGCGGVDTMQQDISIEYKTYEYLESSVYFEFESDYNGDTYNYDTLRVCPNESIQARAIDNWSNAKLVWDLGNNVTRFGERIEFGYANAGVYQVMLSATDQCQRSAGTYQRTVKVDSTLLPDAMLQVTPMAACPGEEIYFFDDNFDDKSAGYSYDIEFGDGATVSGIKELSDHPLQVLAYHTYTEDTFNVSFKATNICGNTVELNTPVMISNDPTREPFIYVGNSSSNHDGPVEETQDWSMSKGGNEHEFIIDVRWMDWSAGLNDTFYVFGWYGGFYPESGQGDPAGMVMFTSSTINNLDSVKVYVPIDTMAAGNIGFAVGWYCEPGMNMGDEPESFGMVVDTSGMPINSLPISAGAVTRIRELTGGAPVMLEAWDGICNKNSVEGYWTGWAKGNYVQLDMYKNSGVGYYNLNTASDEMGNNYMYISGGEYYQTSDTTVTFIENTSCNDTSEYKIHRSPHGLSFNVVSDNCSMQLMNLDSVPFMEGNNSYGNKDKSACVGDPVKFQVAGGATYLWNFGDGTSSTQQYPLHAYGAEGEYDVLVQVTNNCGRIDTAFTKVNVSSTNRPDAYFEVSNYAPKTGEEIKFFRYREQNSPESFWKYSWDFGDGATDTLMEPTHIFEKAGEYEIRLKLENGCGVGENSMFVYVKEANECSAEARFQFTTSDLTVVFDNSSVGANSKFNWSFGDGSTSSEANPTHTYNEAGIYEVCLSVFDTIQQCANRVCLEIQVGNVACFADFGFNINNTELKVSFLNFSNNANEVLWDFGDQVNSSKLAPIHYYPAAGNYWVTLSIFDTITGCYDERKKEIFVGDIDTATSCFADFEFFIDSLAVNFKSIVIGNITDGYWNFGDGQFGYVPDPTHKYTKPGLYKVCINVFDSISGCQAEKCKEIQIGTVECYADFGFVVDSLNQSVDFINRSKGNYTDMYLDFGDGIISGIIDTSHVYPNRGEYKVCLTVFNKSNDCYSEICKTIIIPGAKETPCKAAFSFMVEEGSLQVRFNENATVPFKEWYWNFGDDNYGKDKSTTHTYSEPGLYKVCLSAFNDSVNCFDKVCRDVVVEGVDSVATLVPDFKALIDQNSASVKFKNTSTGDFTNAYWIFGDGTMSDNKDTISHQYASGGRYQVCLKLYNSNTGNSNEICKLLTIGERECTLAADFEYFANPDSNLVRFSDASSGTPDSWFWTFGDGKTSSKVKPIHRYGKAGYYLVTLAVRNSVTGCTNFNAQLVQVGSIDCYADFDYSIDPTTNTVKFKNISSGDPTNNYWLFDDGNNSEMVNPEHVYSKSGMYFVGLAISDNSGLCNSFNMKPIQVGTVDCNADFTVYVDSTSNTAYFTADVMGQADELVWTFGDGGIAQGKEVRHKYTAPGYFNVGLTALNASGCMDYTEDAILIGQIGRDVEPDFFYRVDETNDQVNFFDNTKGEPVKYFWYFSDGDTSTMKNPVKVFPGGGYYSVCLTAQNAEGVSNTKCKQVRVSSSGNECLAQFINSVDSATMKASFTDISYGEPDTWLWKFDDGQTSTDQHPVVTFDSAGVYKVQLTIENSATSCKSHSFGLLNVGKGQTGLLAAFSYDIDSTGFKKAGHPVDFVGFPNNRTAQFSWDFGDLSPSFTGALTFTHYYETEGIYTACFTVTDPVTGATSTVCEDVEAKSESTGVFNANMNMIELTAFPNPFTDFTRIVFDLPMASNVELNVYDESGKHIETILDNYQRAGESVIDWDGSYLLSGLYMLQLRTETGIIKHIAIVKN